MTDSHYDESTARRYRLLRVALESFSCEPADMTAEQQQEAERIVARQTQIENAVLGSEDAGGVVVSETQAEGAWKEISARYENEDALVQTMERHGLAKDNIMALLMRELRVEAVLERISAGVPEVAEADVQAYYEQNADKFRRPPSRTARHILITINPDYPENEREAALAKAHEIAKRVEEKPERFADQAMKHSECPTSLHGGLLGQVTPGTLYPEIDACLFEMRVGQVEVVESPVGYHVVLCETINPERVIKFKECAESLQARLQDRLRQARQREWIAGVLSRKAASEDKVHG